MSYLRFTRGNRRDYERYAHERDDPQSGRPRSDKPESGGRRNGGDGLDARPYSRDARRTMESHTSLRTDEPNAEYRYQYQYEQASYMEIYSHNAGPALGQTLQHATVQHGAGQHGPDWRLHPLSLSVGPDIARQFHWKAETGTIYTYEHGLTCRYIHLDRITRQFCDQQRNPLSADRALAHAMPHPDEVAASQAVQEAQQAVQPLPAPALPAPSFTGQTFDGQSLVGQWKAASAVRERSELSVGSFVRRADLEAQESHDRFTASAVRFLQHELPPGTGALVRIYRKLTMKASQMHPAAAEAPMSRLEAQPVQAQHLYAESAPPLARPVQPVTYAGELNVAAFTRRAA